MTEEHRIVGVGLCSCGDTYIWRWLDRDEWWAEHLAETSRSDGAA